MMHRFFLKISERARNIGWPEWVKQFGQRIHQGFLMVWSKNKMVVGSKLSAPMVMTFLL
jgi:hypothetical protein